MKIFFNRIPFIALLCVICGMFTSCDPSAKGGSAFALKVKEVGPEYVEIQVTAPAALEMAYVVKTTEQIMNNPWDIFDLGVNLVVKPNDVIRINTGLKESTQYYVYAVAALDAENFSPIITLPFKTGVYNFDELLTVVEQFYDGYKMRITVPEETKKRENAIRYNQCCILMYNYMADSDDYSALLYNGGKCVIDDTTITYSEEENWYQTDIDSNGDQELDWDNQYNPVSPGEPVVFVAGEFSYMEDSKDYETTYFKFPSGWDPGYYMPLINEDYFSSFQEGGNEQSSVGIIDAYEISKPMDKYWKGAFQRKHFRVKQPEKFDGTVDVQVVESTPINVVMELYPDESVTQYAIGVFDDAMYNQVLALCNGQEEYLQWAITSYFAAYTLGTRVAKGDVQLSLTTFYYQEKIKADADYHVLITAMGDDAASVQNFQHEVVRTAQKKHWDEKEEEAIPAEIQVTAVPELSGPYKATFNIKCTTAPENPALRACYAANYLREWKLMLNSGTTYWNLVSGNFGTETQASANEFYGDDLDAINSPEGLNITIESVDGETTRLAVACYNEDYTPNNFNYSDIEQCPAVADYTTPYYTDIESNIKPWVPEEYYHDLADEWIAEAWHVDSEGKNRFKWTSNITIAKDLLDYPKTLTQEIYDIYKKTGEHGKEKDEVDAMWMEFHQYAEEVTQKRLRDHNRLVGIGWLDSDSYKLLSGRTPYDLFIATDYMSVDVSSLYNDYGIKWYIEASIDENDNVSYFIPFDSNILPPAHNWSGTFYLGGGYFNAEGEFVMVTYGDGWQPSFPVTVSEDRNTMTIHPLVYKPSATSEEITLYPNMIGIKDGATVLENPIVSEITLKRNTSGTAAQNAKANVARRSASSVNVVGELPADNYKPRTELVATAPLKEMEAKIMSVEAFKERADKFIEKKYKVNNK